MSYKPHQTCRACGYGPPLNSADIKAGESPKKLASILNLGVMPLPNAFRKAGESRPGHYPVELMVCPNCHLGQLSATVDPGVMYSDYPYVTSPSDTMKEHFKTLWATLSGMGTIKTVVEIGSNDGLCLEVLRGLGAERVWGIDPAANLVKIANDRGVPSECSLFDYKAAYRAVGRLPQIDLILARHVFCHIDNWDEFLNDIATMCFRDTLVCIEVPYAGDMIANCEWDTVYAEHLSYLTIESMLRLVEKSALRLHHVVRFPIHGGAIGMVLRRSDCQEPPNASVAQFLAEEHCTMADWEAFAAKARAQTYNLEGMVRGLREQGKRVVGYGASAKSTVWINACGFDRGEIEAVYDYTPQKWYTTIPGTSIPVKHEGAFYADAADYAVVWCWNFLPEILKRQEKWARGGGHFIVPVPEVKVI